MSIALLRLLRPIGLLLYIARRVFEITGSQSFVLKLA
jgi:hypothetical protein